MARTAEKIFLGLAVLLALAFLIGPAKIQLLFTGEGLTGAFAVHNVRYVLQAPLFWIILFVVLCVLVYATSKKK